MKEPRKLSCSVGGSFVTMVLVACGAAAVTAQEGSPQYAVEVVGATSVSWRPEVAYDSVSLTVVGPDETVLTRTFGRGDVVGVALSELSGKPEDGTYVYELRFAPRLDEATRAALAEGRASGDAGVVARLRRDGKLPAEPQVQSGSFLVDGGLIVPRGGLEPERGPLGTGSIAGGAAGSGLVGPLDVVHQDDVIITGNQCIGYDCRTDGTESFGSDAIKTRKNVTQMYFDDTSTAPGFPANDWRLIVNEVSSGGANLFVVEDSTSSTRPFRIAAGARTNAVSVSGSGRVGLGTATPVLGLHLAVGDTPAVRLHQDGTGGWIPYIWDVAGNETNFFVRDTTGGSRLPFRITPGTPSNTLTLKADGSVGIGTWSPAHAVELSRTGEDAAIAVVRTDGATGYLTSASRADHPNPSPPEVRIGSATNHRLSLDVGGVSRVTVATNGNVGIGTATPRAGLDVQGSVAVTGLVDGRDVSADGAALDTLGTTVVEGFARTQAGVLRAGDFVPSPVAGQLTASVVLATPYGGATRYAVTLTPVATAAPPVIWVTQKTATGFKAVTTDARALIEVDWQTQPVER